MICVRLKASDSEQPVQAPVSNAQRLEDGFRGVEGYHLRGQIVKVGKPSGQEGALWGRKRDGQWLRGWCQQLT